MSTAFSLIPQSASTFSSQIDWITIGLLIASALVMILVFGLMIVFGVLYRAGSPRSRESQKPEQWKLEWGWSFATFVLFMCLFGWASTVFFKMHVAPPGSTEIMVVGKQWMWKIQHPNGKREINELHVPINTPVLLTMTSEDVIHSFFVPAFRVKQDVLPGRYTRLWFNATREGEYHLFCSQYCGTQHASMIGRVVVQSRADYQRWLQSGAPSDATGSPQPTLSMASRGERLFTRLGCISCHGVNPGVMAPVLQGLYGSRVGLSDGTSVIADEDYIRESILNPKAKITQGYQSIMPAFAGIASEEDVLDLIAFVKTLKVTPQGAAP